jgi:hypothetical protein
MANVDIIIRMIDQTGVASNKTIANLKNTVSAMAPYLAAFSAAAVFISNASKETAKYNAEIRDLSLISGQGAVASSKFLQVLDDFELTASDATSAARFLKDKGLSPSIETLAKLADEFKKIEDPAQRMVFLQDNLGKGGAKWANILSQDSDALIEAANSANKYLIKTDEQIKKSEIARLAVDDLGDSWAGFKNKIGDTVNEIIVTNQAMTRANEIIVENGGVINFNTQYTQEWKDALAQAKEEQMATAESSLAMGDSMAEAAQKIKEEEEALKELSKTNQEFLSSVETITERNKDYQTSLDEVKQKYADGQLSTEEYQTAINKLATEQELASRRMILSMLEQELARDGLTTKETDALLKLGAKWGIYSDTAIAEARQARDEVNSLLAGIQDKTVSVYVQQIGGYDMGTQQYNNIAYAGRASGGGASGLTWVGENGRELVRLPQGSNVYSNGQSERMAGGNDGAILAALESIKPDYKKLARAVRDVSRDGNS